MKKPVPGRAAKQPVGQQVVELRGGRGGRAIRRARAGAGNCASRPAWGRGKGGVRPQVRPSGHGAEDDGRKACGTSANSATALHTPRCHPEPFSFDSLDGVNMETILHLNSLIPALERVMVPGNDFLPDPGGSIQCCHVRCVRFGTTTCLLAPFRLSVS